MSSQESSGLMSENMQRDHFENMEENPPPESALATLQKDFMDEISKKIQSRIDEWTPQLPWTNHSKTDTASANLEDGASSTLTISNPFSSTKALALLDQFNDLEGTIFEQGSLAYATATGDVKFLMKFLGSKMLEHPGLKFTISPRNGWTRMHRAAAEGDAQMIQVLQWRGEDNDARAFDGSTPLCIACETGNFRCAAVLLGFGRGVTSFPRHLTSRKPNTPQRAQEVEAIQWSYANPSISRNDGCTPLMLSLARADSLCTGVILLAFALDNWAHQLCVGNSTRLSEVESNNTSGGGGGGATTVVANTKKDEDEGPNTPSEEHYHGEEERRKDVLSAHEVAALMLTFPAYDPPSEDDETRAHEVVVPLLKQSPLADPRQWKLYNWINGNPNRDSNKDDVDEANHGDGLGAASGHAEELWQECTDKSFSREFLVSVEVTNDCLIGYLKRYNRYIQEGRMNQQGDSGETSVRNRSTTSSSSSLSSLARIASDDDFKLAKSISSKLQSLEQLVYLGVVTYLETKGHVLSSNLATIAPMVILSSLKTNYSGSFGDNLGGFKSSNQLDTKSKTGEAVNSDGSLTEKQRKDFVSLGSVGIENRAVMQDEEGCSAVRIESSIDNVVCLSAKGPSKSQLLTGAWAAASVAHLVCSEEQENILMASSMAKASLHVSKASKYMSKKITGERKKMVKDTLDAQWLKTAPQVGLLAPPPVSHIKYTHLLEIALLSCRTRCMQAIIEKLPLKERESKVKSLYTMVPLNDQTTLKPLSNKKQNQIPEKPQVRKVFSKQQGYTYAVRLIAVEGDECIPQGWKGGIGSIYSACCAEDEIVEEDEEKLETTISRDVENASSPSEVSGGGGGGGGEKTSSLSSNSHSSDNSRTKGRYMPKDICPLKDGVKVGTLLPQWPEAWVKRAHVFEATRIEISQLKVNAVDAFKVEGSNKNGLDSLEKDVEDDDGTVSGYGNVESSGGDEGDIKSVGAVASHDDDASFSSFRCMSCSVKFNTLQETEQHVCTVSDENFIRRNHRENTAIGEGGGDYGTPPPKVGERVLCFLPDISTYITSADKSHCFELKGRWCAADVVSFHSHEESRDLRDDMEMFLDLMSTTFE